MNKIPAEEIQHGPFKMPDEIVQQYLQKYAGTAIFRAMTSDEFANQLRSQWHMEEQSEAIEAAQISPSEKERLQKSLEPWWYGSAIVSNPHYVEGVKRGSKPQARINSVIITPKHT